MAATSRHMQFVEGVRDTVKGLTLSGLDPSNISIIKVEETGRFKIDPPGIGILGPPLPEEISQDEELQDHGIWYPCYLILRLSDPTSDLVSTEIGEYTTLDTLLRWREQIIDALWDKQETVISNGGPSSLCEVTWRSTPTLNVGAYNSSLMLETRLLFLGKCTIGIH